MSPQYTLPASLQEAQNDLCPGCLQGIAIRLIAELLEEMAIDHVHFLSLGTDCPVGAQGWGEYTIFRPPFAGSAMSTGIKRMMPEQTVLLYQGEGNNLPSNISDTIHTANRGDGLTVISIKNLSEPSSSASFTMPSGFAGGMRPPTMPFVNTLSSQAGLKTAEAIAALPNSRYVARVSLHNPNEIRKAKAALKKALEVQIYDNGYAFVEILMVCTGPMGIDPDGVSDYIEQKLLKDYPLGEIKTL